MTLTEAMVSAAIVMGITGAVFSMVDPVHGLVQAQPEASDMQQRIRVAVGVMTAAVMGARAIVPRRVGRIAPDAEGVFRAGTLAAISASGTDTYYLERSQDGGSLMHYDGDQTDLPVADHVVGLTLDFFGAVDGMPPVLLDPAVAAGANVPIARVRVHLRVQAAARSLRGPAGPLFVVGGTSTSSRRFLPDQFLQFDVALRTR